MNIPERYFQNADGVIKWHQENVPGSYERYCEIREKIKASGFPGWAKLLRRVDSDGSVTGFASSLTEMNLANVLLDQRVGGLAYESEEISKVDFIFDNIAIEVKNLHPKDYEKNEQGRIEEMRVEGGGTTTFTHKNFSETLLQVKKTSMGTLSWARTETGHSGFLDSDLYEMSAPLGYMGDFEQKDVGDRKRVLFFFIQSGEFAHYYVADIVAWYFGAQDYQHFIFQNDMQWYYKLFTKPEKNNGIDGLVFMYAPGSILSWPPGCMNDMRDGKTRLTICTREKDFEERLKGLLIN